MHTRTKISTFARLTLGAAGLLGLAATAASAAPAAPVFQAQDRVPFGVDAQWDGRWGGMVITRVMPDSRAAKAGVEVGDLVVGGQTSTGQPVDVRRGGAQAFGFLVGHPRFTVSVYRQGRQTPVQLRVGGAAAEGTSRVRARGGEGTSFGRTRILVKGKKPKTPKMTLELQKHDFRDNSAFQGMHSHTMLVPQGWSVKGGPLWIPQNGIFQHFQARVSSPEGREIAFDVSRSFMFSQDPVYVEGARRSGAMASFVRPPQHVGEAALLVLVPALRPGATNVELLEAVRDEDAEVLMNKLSPMTGMSVRPVRTCECAVVRYEQGGQTFEECIWWMQMVTRMPSMMGRPPLFSWATIAARSFRAPAGKLEAELASLITIANTLKETPRWGICSRQLASQISRIKHKGHMDRMRIMRQTSQQIARNNESISDSQMASWRRRQAMQDEGQKKSVNGILEVHDYKTRDGNSLALDHGFNRVFQDPSGNVILTNDANFDPATDARLRTNDWKQLERIR